MNQGLFSSSIDISLSNPAELVSAVPFLLGYPPVDSIVLIGLDGERIAVTGRVALPGADEPLEGFATIAQALRNNDVSAAIVIGFGHPDQVTRCIDHLREAIADLEVELVDALRVTNGRYWSYLCGDLRCCPAEGRPLDIDDTAIAAEFTAAGAQVKSDRDTVLRQLDAVTGPERDAMNTAIARVTEVLGDPVDERLLRERGRSILARCADTLELPGHEDSAWLSMALPDEAILDEAMMSVDQHPPDGDSTALWVWLTRHAGPEHRALCAAVLSYAAWRCGNGVVAGEAARIAGEHEPRHHLTDAMLQILCNGVPPWADVES
ncbi:MAG TPA: DUF4192 domain-containing protein [Candidatus Stackebrandtia excrementipullorum]|nr:DUF4192 domain-containing protein [Candidatus Stackebrandtia excrementipullorum]